jgi:prevent-host-death family protein
MANSAPARSIQKVKPARAIADLDRWKLEDAKARLSEVVRLASSDGPQLVTIRGKEAAIVLDPETYRQLLPPAKQQPSLVDFLQSLDLSGIDFERDQDTGREIVL